MTDMRVLKASNKLTQTINSSAGSVSFEEGIATEFTDGQAKHFTEKLRGYEVVSLSVEKVAALAPKPAIEPTQEEELAAPESKAIGLIGNIKNLPGILVGAYDEDGRLLASTVSDENGDYALPAQKCDFDVKFYGNNVSDEDMIEEVINNEMPEDVVEKAEPKPATEEAEIVSTEGEEKVETKASAEITESPKGSSENVIKLPVLQDSVKKITKFCKTYDIKYEGTKAEMCEKIYADPRFASKK